MAYMVFDLETQIHQSNKRKANPFDERNYIAYRGWKVEGDRAATAERFLGRTAENFLRIPDDVDTLVGHSIKFDLLYEMVAKVENIRAFFKRGGGIWCTQLAEYLINAQQRKYHMNSMDQIVETYGGRKKIDIMKEMWQAGIQTSEIDEDIVLDYLIGTEEERRNSGDIGNTELIYLGQLELAESLDMMNAIEVRMTSLAATTEMEFNGIQTDPVVAMTDLKDLNVQLAEANLALDEFTKEIPDEVGFSWGSGAHKSCIIYGGTIKYQMRKPYIDEATGDWARKKETARWPLFDGEATDVNDLWFDNESGRYCTADSISTTDGLEVDGVMHCDVDLSAAVWQDTFKSGKQKGEPKFKNVTVPGELKIKYQSYFHKLPGYVDPDKYEIKKLDTTDGVGERLRATDSDTLELLGNLDVPFLKALGRRTALDKEIGTYYVTVDAKGEKKGMLTCVNPATKRIHHMLNHTSTVTSRLSSSNPNCQNIPRGDKSRVKAMFVSRFGDDGLMCEIDYSQLEVVVQGMLSEDTALVADLKAKVDFHCKRLAIREGTDYDTAFQRAKDPGNEFYEIWDVFRTECKIFSFQRAYGAGAPTIALSANMEVEQVKEMIAAEERTYPGIKRFNESVEAEIVATAEPFKDRERGFRTFRRGTWQAPTGTLYSWRSYDAPAFMKKRGVLDSFSLPEIMNYPTQGTGGEIVQMTLGLLHRWFMDNNNFGGKAFLINTVHDCVWFDCHKDVVDHVMAGAKRIMENVRVFLKKIYGIDCPVDFPVDVEVGPNMLDLHHWEP